MKFLHKALKSLFTRTKSFCPVCNKINAGFYWRLFGQNNHVGLYAHDDYVFKIKSHGYGVHELGGEYFGKNVFERLGLIRSSILYVVSK